MAQNISTSERKVHTVRIHLGDTLANLNLDVMDEVEIELISNAQNKPMTPIKLSYSALMRLTRDQS